MEEAQPSTLEGELDELQRRYRMMEADRKLYADEVQNVVRKQKAQIEKLKRENAQLKQELQLQQRASAVGDGSIASVKVMYPRHQSEEDRRKPGGAPLSGFV